MISLKSLRFIVLSFFLSYCLNKFGKFITVTIPLAPNLSLNKSIFSSFNIFFLNSFSLSFSFRAWGISSCFSFSTFLSASSFSWGSSSFSSFFSWGSSSYSLFCGSGFSSFSSFSWGSSTFSSFFGSSLINPHVFRTISLNSSSLGIIKDTLS